jgi:hypothetical protein
MLSLISAAHAQIYGQRPPARPHYSQRRRRPARTAEAHRSNPNSLPITYFDPDSVLCEEKMEADRVRLLYRCPGIGTPSTTTQRRSVVPTRRQREILRSPAADDTRRGHRHPSLRSVKAYRFDTGVASARNTWFVNDGFPSSLVTVFLCGGGTVN